MLEPITQEDEGLLQEGLREMYIIRFALCREINKTAKWRFVKRYRLLSNYYELEGAISLVEHITEDR